MIAVWYLGRSFFLVRFLFSSEFRLLRILTRHIFVYYYCYRLAKSIFKLMSKIHNAHKEGDMQISKLYNNKLLKDKRVKDTQHRNTFKNVFHIDWKLLHAQCIYNSLYYFINNREQTNIGQTQTVIYIKSTNHFSENVIETAWLTISALLLLLLRVNLEFILGTRVLTTYSVFLMDYKQFLVIVALGMLHVFSYRFVPSCACRVKG